MAEGYARYLGHDKIAVQSAGVEAHGKNPRAISIMAEDGVDIAGQESTLITPAMIAWADVVVTVCGHADEVCPSLSPDTDKIYWPLNDPAKATGTEEAIMATFRATRDEIKQKVTQLLETLSGTSNGTRPRH